jgi:hypothetical protein
MAEKPKIHEQMLMLTVAGSRPSPIFQTRPWTLPRLEITMTQKNDKFEEHAQIWGKNKKKHMRKQTQKPNTFSTRI